MHFLECSIFNVMIYIELKITRVIAFSVKIVKFHAAQLHYVPPRNGL